MKFVTQKTSNPLPYDEPVTTVALEIAPDLVIHFDGVWHDDYEQPGEGDRNVEAYVAQLKESLDRFVIERILGLPASEESKNAIRAQLTKALKDHPLP
jgi:hypothetical protein